MHFSSINELGDQVEAPELADRGVGSRPVAIRPHRRNYRYSCIHNHAGVLSGNSVKRGGVLVRKKGTRRRGRGVEGGYNRSVFIHHITACGRGSQLYLNQPTSVLLHRQLLECFNPTTMILTQSQQDGEQWEQKHSQSPSVANANNPPPAPSGEHK